jgi:hypothetical protein
MTRKSKTKEEPRIGRKDLQDPDRDVRSPRQGRSRPADSDSPRPTDDAPVAK